MKPIRALALAATLLVPLPALSQGVPVIDSRNLLQNIEQLRAFLRDATRQLEQLEELRTQVERLTNIEALLQDVLGSVSGLNEIAGLFNDLEDLRDRAQKVTDLSGLTDSLSLGDFEGLLASLLDGEVSVGGVPATEALRDTMANAGFSETRLVQLNSGTDPRGEQIADLAAANAVAITAAQLSYEEAQASLARIEGLVAAIGDQRTLKDSIDLNTRMAAETNFMLGQMWRLNAAQGLARGQTGIDLAAEQARTRAFFVFSGSGQ